MRKVISGLLSAGLIVALVAAVLLPQSRTLRAVDARDRTLSIHNIHNGEDITITFRKDGKFVPDALDKLNWFFRDWRTNVPTKMDPELFDIIWEIHEELGSRVPVHLVSGYRSPATNAALRKGGGGQAKFSKHMLGQASDIHFPDVPVQKIRYSALVRERGGVGYYPTSAVPFVHVDTGRVRMWPRMPRQELALLFPNGRSKYVPVDGKPIGPSDVTNARANYSQLASAIAAFHQFRAGAKDRTLVAALEPQIAAEQPAERPPASSSDDEGEIADAQPVAAATAAPATGPVMTAAVDDGLPTLDGPALAKPAKSGLQLASADAAALPVPKPVLAKRQVVLASLGGVPQRTGLDKLISSLKIEASLTLPKVEEPSSVIVAAADETLVVPEPQPVDQQAFLSRVGWTQAPDYDADHDSELSYRAFPLGPLLSRSPSINDPVLAALQAPDLGLARDLIGRDDELGLGFLPRWQVAELPWGGEITNDDLSLILKRAPGASGNPVKTALR